MFLPWTFWKYLLLYVVVNQQESFDGMEAYKLNKLKKITKERNLDLKV